MVFIPAEFIPEYRTARKYSFLSGNGWWLNQWPLLGWLETFVKIAAWCFVPYIPVPNAPLARREDVSLDFAAETVIMLVAAGGIGAAIIDRMIYREIVSIIFVFPNNWAHWTVAMTMYKHGQEGINARYLRIFCWLMLAGDVVKLAFFAFHDFSRLNVSRYFLYALVTLYVCLYGLVLLIDYGYVGSNIGNLYAKIPFTQLLGYRRR